jgi:hypothetical protein
MLGYEALYEHHGAAAASEEEVVGAGDLIASARSTCSPPGSRLADDRP